MSDKIDLILDYQKDILNKLTTIDQKMTSSENDIISLKKDMMKAKTSMTYQWWFIIFFWILFTILFF